MKLNHAKNHFKYDKIRAIQASWSPGRYKEDWVGCTDTLQGRKSVGGDDTAEELKMFAEIIIRNYYQKYNVFALQTH